MTTAGFLILFFVVATSASGIIDARLESRYKLKGAGGRENVLISFTPSIKEVIDEINGMTFPSLAAKRTALTNAQQVFTKRAQGSIQTYLTIIGAKFESFWINNKMIIKDAEYALLLTLIFYPGVAKIEPEPVVQLAMPNVVTTESDVVTLQKQGKQSSTTWGIRKIRADRVWNLGWTGRRIVVAGIDTGVRYTHEAVRSGWRRNYGWFDPADRTPTPYDNNGHGTHTMGTIVGEFGIGVAPGATWIACKACNSNGKNCNGGSLINCGQWVQCPTRADGSSKNCNYAPHIVSNSWGTNDGGSGRWYDDIISSWHASGIIPVFANGNDGTKGCGTTNTPGGSPYVISVGNMDENNRLAADSSKGPSRDGELKPDIVAPGTDVASAWYDNDSAYNYDSGTSMACPHVAGVIALMLEKNPKLTYDQIYNVITNTAERNSLDSEAVSGWNCGSIPSNRFPNNLFGYGRIDALNSVNAV